MVDPLAERRHDDLRVALLAAASFFVASLGGVGWHFAARGIPGRTAPTAATPDATRGSGALDIVLTIPDPSPSTKDAAMRYDVSADISADTEADVGDAWGAPSRRRSHVTPRAAQPNLPTTTSPGEAAPPPVVPVVNPAPTPELAPIDDAYTMITRLRAQQAAVCRCGFGEGAQLVLVFAPDGKLHEVLGAVGDRVRQCVVDALTFRVSRAPNPGTRRLDFHLHCPRGGTP